MGGAVVSEMRIQPLTWREQLRANGMRLFDDLHSAFANTSPLMTRAFLATATVLAAIGLWTAGDEWVRLFVFEAMRTAMPRWVWALLFTIGGLAQWWRLVDDEPRLYVGMFVNAYVSALWCLVTIEIAWSGSMFVAAPASILFLQGAWLTLRTGATHLDRRRA